MLPGGADYGVVEELLSRGVEVYAYLHNSSDDPIGLGSLFRKVVSGEWSLDQYIGYVEQSIDRYAGVFTGVFLDECDPGYFTDNPSPGNSYVEEFASALETIVSYAHSKGLRVFINGVRAFANISDYYLWEDFVALYDSSSNSYVLDENFFSTSSSNPYEWVNGIAKYEYLAENGLLNRTIALSFADTGSLGDAEVAYYMARVLGLAGWGFAPIDIYAGGGPVATIEVYEPGPPVSDPVLDPGSKTAWRMFTAGNISVDLGSGSVSTPFGDYPRAPVIDAVLDSGVGVAASATGSGGGASLELRIYSTYTPRSVYIYANGSWPGDPGTGLLHVYIDSDGSSTTGYSVAGIGADYLVEVYTSGGAKLFNYTGSGSDWSWSEVSSLSAAVAADPGYRYRVELGVPSNIVEQGVTRVVAAPVSQWSDLAYTNIITVPDLVPAAPSIYGEYNATFEPIITSASISDEYALIGADAASGVLAEYRVVVPYAGVAAVYKNNTPLEEKQSLGPDEEGYTAESMGNYTKLVIHVQHSSPVTIRIEPAPQPVPESFKAVLVSTVVTATIILLVPVLGRKRGKNPKLRH